MPSPVGHALAGLTAGWLVAGAPERGAFGDAGGVRRAVTFAALGVLPDLDLLVGAHSGPTHGIGAAVIVGLLAAAMASGNGRLRVALASAAAYGSHILLDWLGSDTSPPIGIMALWPFSRDYFESAWHVFPAVSRRYWQPEMFWSQNLRALMAELAVLAPLLAVTWLTRGRRRPPAS